MKKQLTLYLERAYPYVISGIACFIMHKMDFVFVENTNLNSLIDGIVTMESIVIGLIGAIIPVILSMKNESKFVKYVFENDEERLFRKYLTSTIGVGLLSMAFSLALYIRSEYSAEVLKWMYFLWLYLIILFLILTYRSMRYMIIIIFTPDMSKGASNDICLEENERQELRKKRSVK